jgi:hypothetical protein
MYKWSPEVLGKLDSEKLAFWVARSNETTEEINRANRHGN